jgi:hypothetical protein
MDKMERAALFGEKYKADFGYAGQNSKLDRMLKVSGGNAMDIEELRQEPTI